MSDICKCGHGHMVHVRWDYPLDDDDSRLWTCTHTNCGCREYQPQLAPTAEERFTAEYVGTACPCHNKMLCPNDLNTTITTTAPTGVEESVMAETTSVAAVKLAEAIHEHVKIVVGARHITKTGEQESISRLTKAICDLATETVHAAIR